MSAANKLWILLTSNQRRAAIILLGLMLVGALMETLGVGVIIPALALMTQNNLATRYPALDPWLSRLGYPSQEQLIVIGMLALVGMYTVKAVFLAILAWRQARFVAKLQESVSNRLFSGYLYQPYTFHIQRNSAQLIHNTTTQASDIAIVCQYGIVLCTELLVLMGVLMLLLLVEPLGTAMIIGIFGLAGWGFNRLTRRRTLNWGKARQYHEELRLKHLQQGLGSVKDMKLLGRETSFIAQYQAQSEGSARIHLRHELFSALPRLWLELLAVGGLAALIVLMIKSGKPVEALLPTLGVFSAAAFRTMPSANRIINSFQSLAYYLPSINSIYQEFKAFAPNEEIKGKQGAPLPFDKVLKLDGVTFHYPEADMPSVQGVSISIPQGSSIGIIGSSGAGKSTMVDIILGLLKPSGGTICVDGVDIQSNLRGWQDHIGYVPQHIYLTDDTLRKNIAFGLPEGQIDEEAVWAAARAAQLDKFISELPQGLDTVVGERGTRLSGGQRQRIGIARALYHNPAVLVLDEATSSLDVNTERDVMDAVRAMSGHKTTIIVAHRLSTVEYCDHIYRIERGRLVGDGKAKMQ